MYVHDLEPIAESPDSALRGLFCPEIVCVCACAPVEARHLAAPLIRASASMTESSRADFLTGRACAHQALSKLGLEGVAVLRGEQGEPLWPEGIVGSITHCIGFWAAAVARASCIQALGMDAEVCDRLPLALANVVCLPEEREILHTLESNSQCVLLSFLFSAKESVFKCLYPLQKRFLDFQEIALDFLPGRRFQATISPKGDYPSLPAGISGRYVRVGDLVMTAAWMAP